jgi:hypothetical protein
VRISDIETGAYLKVILTAELRREVAEGRRENLYLQKPLRFSELPQRTLRLMDFDFFNGRIVINSIMMLTI